MKNFLYKFCLFQVLFCLAFFANAQNVQLNSPSLLTAGVTSTGTTGEIKLTITNNTGSALSTPAGTFPYTLSIASGISGLNFIATPAFTSSDPNAQVNFGSFTEGQTQITFAITLAAGSTINITTQAFAGYCVNFGQASSIVISNPFEYAYNGVSTRFNNPLTILPGSSLNHDIGNDINLVTPLGSGNIITRSYLVSVHNSNFNGFITFKEMTVGAAIHINSVKFQWLQGGVTTSQTFSNPQIGNNDFVTGIPLTLAVLADVNTNIIIIEEVNASGCLTGGNGQSQAQIQWGFKNFDLICGVPQTQPGGNIFNNSAASVGLVQNDLSKTDYDSHLSCWGDAAPGNNSEIRDKRVTYRNNGGAIAKNLSILFNAAPSNYTNIMVPRFINGNENNVRAIITRSDGSVEPYEINYNFGNIASDMSASYVYGQSGLQKDVPLYLFNTDGTPVPALDLVTRWQYNYQSAYPFRVNFITDLNYKRLADNSANLSTSTCLENGDATLLIFDLIIEKLVDPNNPNNTLLPINLNPGDEITIEWKEEKCCFSQNYNYSILAGVNFSGQYFQDYPQCNTFVKDGFDFQTNAAYMQLSQNTAPGPVTLAGNPDFCLNTADGYIETISSILSKTNFDFSGDARNTDGSLKIRFYLEHGLDLDLSLTKPHQWFNTPLGFNNLSNSSSGCKSCVTDIGTPPGTCDLNNTILGTQYGIDNNGVANIVPTSQYDIKLTLKDGRQFVPKLTLLASDGRTPDLQNNTPPGTPIPFSIASQDGSLNNHYAAFLYELSIDLNQISSVSLAEISQMLDGASLNVKLRAYCAPHKSGQSIYKEVFLIDKCNGAGSCSTTSSAAIPFFSKIGNYQVNCPGCVIPGSNVSNPVINRTSANLGWPDSNDDGLYDSKVPITSTLSATTGDQLITYYTVDMSDGEDYGPGSTDRITKAQMINGIPDGTFSFDFNTGTTVYNNTPPYILDNFYVSCALPPNVKVDNIEFALVSSLDPDYTSITSWTPGVLFTDMSGARISAPSLGLNNFMGFGMRFVVRTTYTITDNIGPAENYDITFTTGFSALDNGTKFPTLDANPASSVIGDFLNVMNPSSILYTRADKPYIYEDAFLWCTNGAVRFRFIPYSQGTEMRYTDQSGYHNKCEKNISLSNDGRFWNTAYGDPIWNAFEKEYRRFIDVDKPMLFQCPIPAGYTLSKMEVINVNNGAKNRFEERFINSDPSVLNTFLTTVSNTNYPKLFSIQLNFTEEDLANPVVFPADGYFYSTGTYDKTNTRLLIRDENYNIMVSLTLIPDNCPTTPASISMTDDAKLGNFKAYSNFPHNTNNPNSLLQVGNVVNLSDYMNSNFGTVTRPQANLITTSLSLQAQEINSSQLQLQVRLANDQNSPSQANFPFMQVYGHALTKGLTVLGVYEGAYNPNPTLSGSLTSNSDLETKGTLIGLPAPDNAIIPGSAETYWVVLSYNCNGCNLDLGCSNGILDPATCLVGDDLFIKSGWNCDAYPTFDNLANVCNISADPLHYTTTVRGYGLSSAQTVYNVSNPVSPVQVPSCSSFPYSLTIQSCKEGSFDQFDIEFTKIPQGLILNTGNVTVNNPAFVIAQSDVNKFHISCASGVTCGIKSDQTITANFEFNTSCTFLQGGIETSVKAYTFCSSPISNNLTSSIFVPFNTSLKDNISFNIANCSPAGFDINYVVSNNPTSNQNEFVIDFPNGIIETGIPGIHQKIIQVPINTVPNSSLNPSDPAYAYYSIHINTSLENASFCSGGTFTTNVINRKYLSETCNNVTCQAIAESINKSCEFTFTALTVNAGPDLSICSGSNIAMNGDVQGGVAPYLYSWTPPSGISNLATFTPSPAPTINTTYTVTVSDYNGCLATDDILITVNACNPICTLTVDAGNNMTYCSNDVGTITLNANGSGAANISYLWSPNGETTQSIDVHPTATTTYTVTVKDIDNPTCSTSTNVTITVNPSPVIWITVDDPTTSSSNDPSLLCPGHSVNLIATSGFTSYHWEKDGVVLSETGSTISVNSAGYYTVSVVANSCTTTVGVIVVTDPVLAGLGEICEGQTPSLFVDLKGAICNSCTPEILKSGGVYPGTGGFNFQDYIGAIPLEACTLYTAPFPVKVKPNPVTPIIDPAFTLVCPNDPISQVLTITNTATFPANSTYAWSTGVTDINNITATAAGRYTVTLLADGCTSQGYAEIVVPEIYLYQTCIDAHTIIINASSNVGGSGIVWTDASGNVITPADPSNPWVITVTSPGIYTATMINPTCGTIIASIDATFSTGTNTLITQENFGSAITPAVYPDPQIPYSCIPAISDLNCVNIPFSGFNQMMGHYTVTFTDAGYWNHNLWNGSGYVLNPGNPTERNYLLADGEVTPLKERVWLRTVTVTQGLRYNFRALVNNVINVEGQVPLVSLRIASVQIPSVPQTIYATMSTQTIYANQARWVELSGNWIADVSGDVEIAIMLDGGGIIGRDIGVDEISFEEIICDATSYGRQCLAKINVGPDKFVCPGTPIQIGANVVVPGSSLQYEWRSGSQIFSNDPNPMVTPSVTTSYTLTVKDLVNNCSAIDNVTVHTINTNTNISVTTQASPAAVCGNGTSQLSATVTGNGSFTYDWTPKTGLSTPQLQSTSAAVTATTTYTVTVTDASNGCSAISDQVTVTVGTPPAPPLVSTGVFCTGTTGGIDIGVTGAGVYPILISSPFSQIYGGSGHPGGVAYFGEVGSVDTDIIAGAVSAEGCTTLVTLPGQVHPAITSVSISSSPSSICSGGSTQLIANITGGTAPFTYSWYSVPDQSFTSSLASPSVSPSSDTRYSLNVTDDAGCYGGPLDDVTVTINPQASVNISADQTGVCQLAFNQNVTWASILGCSFNNGILTKTAAAGWGNSGATSSQSLTESGYVEYVAAQTGKGQMLGLSRAASNGVYQNMTYAINLTTSNTTVIYESGVSVFTLTGNYVVGDNFRISVENNYVVKYYKNNVLIYTSLTPAIFPLKADVAFNTIGGMLGSVKIQQYGGVVNFNAIPLNAGSTPSYQWYINNVASGTNNSVFSSPDLVAGDQVKCVISTNSTCSTGLVTSNVITIGSNLPTPVSVSIIQTSNGNVCTTNSLETVQWKYMNGFNVNNNNLTSNMANAGASSLQTITDGGYVEYQITETGKSKYVGLTHNPSNGGFFYMPYAVNLTTGNIIQIVESQTVKGSFGPYAVNDIIKVAMENNTIRYYRNNILLYTSKVNLTLAMPLIAEVTAITSGSTFNNVRIKRSGNIVSFAATPTNGGSFPTYDWFVNGVLATSESNSAFYSSSLRGGDVVVCRMTSSDLCASGNPVFSSGLTIAGTTTPSVVSVSIQQTSSSPTPICSTSTEPVVWRDINGCSVINNNLTSLTGSWCGASSVQKITEGGYIEYVVTETGKTKYIGLNTYSSNGAFWNTRYAINLNQNNLIQINETSSSSLGTFGGYVLNDVLRIAIENNVVKYYRNNILLYTSLVAPAFPLVADVSLGTNGATCNNLRVRRSGFAAVFTATAVNGGTIPIYNWYVNNVYRGSTNDNVFSSSTLNLNDVVTCSLSSNDPCVSGSPAFSSPLTLNGTAYTSVSPSVSISQTSSDPVCTVNTEEPIIWKSISGCSLDITNNNLTSTAGAWSGASSVQKIYEGGYVEYQITETGKNKLIGLNQTASGGQYWLTKYDVNFTVGNTLVIYELGASKGTFGGYVLNDIIKIAVENNVVNYYKNNVLLYTSKVAPTLPLMVDVAFGSIGCTFNNVQLRSSGYQAVFTAAPINGGTTPIYNWYKNNNWVAGPGSIFTSSVLTSTDVITCTLSSSEACASGNPAVSNSLSLVATPSTPVQPGISISQSTSLCSSQNVQNVTWTNLVGTLSSNGTDLTKTNSSNSWNSGASSVQPVIEGGYVEYRVTGSVTNKAIGLSKTSSNGIYTNIQYAWNIGTGVIIESNVSRGALTTFALNDVARIAVENNTVKYYKNNVLIYTSTITPTLPLIADVSIYASGATLNNVMIRTSGSGNTVSFNATSTNAGTNPLYQWYVNNLTVGTNSPSYTAYTLVNGDKVRCTLSNGDPCVTGNPAVSNEILLSSMACRQTVSNSFGNSVDATWDVELYPNPSMKDVNLRVANSVSEYAKLEVIDMKGILIYKNDEVSTTSIFTFGEDLPSGVYVVKVSDKENQKILRLVITR